MRTPTRTRTPVKTATPSTLLSHRPADYRAGSVKSLVAHHSMPRHRRRFLGWAAAISVIALLVAAVGVAVAYRLAPSPTDEQRQAVQSATRDAVQALLTFAPDTGVEERSAVADQLTGQLAVEYRVRGPEVVFPDAGRGGVSSRARVVGVAVDSLEKTRARVLVFVDQDVLVTGVVGVDESQGGVPESGSPAKTVSATTARWAFMHMVDQRWRLANLSLVGYSMP